eukprot:15455918-Alexandrium_andersonii.AAC.1
MTLISHEHLRKGICAAGLPAASYSFLRSRAEAAATPSNPPLFASDAPAGGARPGVPAGGSPP